MARLNWTRDETILALDVYFGWGGRPFSKSDPAIYQLSKLLQTLPIYPISERSPTFRNPASVYMKLCNFLRLDPGYTADGRLGLQRGAHIDQIVWEQFDNDRSSLAKIAASIRDNSGSVQSIPDYSESEEPEIMEGKLLQRVHSVRERNSGLALKKKSKAQNDFGKLACEVCDFIFSEVYGEPLGEGFIKCHHIVPLSEIQPGTKPRLKDLSLVCSNCHRMLHRGRNKTFLGIQGLRDILRANGVLTVLGNW